MIIAVPFVAMMEMRSDQKIDMISMGDLSMSASGSMLMSGVVLRALVLRCAPSWIGSRNLQRMFHDSILLGMMKVAVMKIVQMVLVLDSEVAAICAMNVIFVRLV